MIAISDVTNGGAEFVGCSPQAVRRYLDKMCSFTGLYEYYSTEEGKRFVRLKPVKEESVLLTVQTKGGRNGQ